MTIAEALSEGYTRCGHEGREYQTLMKIEVLTEDDWEYAEGRGDRIMVADNEMHTAKLDADFLMDYLNDQYHETEENPDDTEDMVAYLKEAKPMIDEFVEKINAIYAKKEWYFLTDIEIIKS